MVTDPQTQNYCVVIITVYVCVVHRIMSLPAAYYTIEFSAHNRCGLQRLRNIVERLRLTAFVLDVSSSSVRFLLVLRFLCI